MSDGVTAYLLERAWVDGAVQDDVLDEIEHGRFTHVGLPRGNSRPPAEGSAGEREIHRVPGETPARLAGLTLPGLANCHSHAFHRALRGRTQRERGTFWTWREQMYALAGRLDPDAYFALARATFREMVAAGYTSVGEFHYLHHQPDGTPYDDPNAMGHAVIQAAAEARIRLALLDTCYVSSGFGDPPDGVQVRYSDGTAERWAERAEAGPAAIHSVRAVPRDQLHVFRGWGPLHIHLSEQPGENEACLDAYGITPTRLLHEEALLGPDTTVVHATHLTDDDIELLGSSCTRVCITPTTERDLADGVGPARRLHEAGCVISIGSDSHAVVDPFEELRGHWTAAELLTTATAHGSLGFDDVGTIAVGQVADLVTIDTGSPRTAGTGADEHTAVYAATSADVVHVVIDGEVAYTSAEDERIGRELDAAIRELWP